MKVFEVEGVEVSERERENKRERTKKPATGKKANNDRGYCWKRQQTPPPPPLLLLKSALASVAKRTRSQKRNEKKRAKRSSRGVLETAPALRRRQPSVFCFPRSIVATTKFRVSPLFLFLFRPVCSLSLPVDASNFVGRSQRE